jgi:hypothetical protein
MTHRAVYSLWFAGRPPARHNTSLHFCRTESLVAGSRCLSRILPKVPTRLTGNVTENELVCNAGFAGGDALLWPDVANQVRSTPASTTPERLAA